MSKVFIEETSLSAIGDAIRAKTGKTELFSPAQMPAEIESIETGGEIEEVVVSGSAFERWLFDGMMEYEDGTLSGTPIDYYNEIEEVYKNYAFSAFNAKSITLPNLIWRPALADKLFYGNIALRSVDLPKLNIIPLTCFYECTFLQSCNLPSAVEVKGQAFRDCYKLPSISLPQCHTIGNSAFQSCQVLNEINAPLLEIVGESAFYYTPIESINFPLLKTIGSNAFQGCSKLTELTLPSLETSGNSAFSNCAELLYVNLPKLTTLGNYIFQNCAKLQKVDLGCLNNITASFKNYSPFRGCKVLDTVIIRSNSVASCSISAKDIFADCTNIINGTGFIYVPKALEEEYKTATNWATIANNIRAIEDYPEICG